LPPCGGWARLSAVSYAPQRSRLPLPALFALSAQQSALSRLMGGVQRLVAAFSAKQKQSKARPRLRR